MPKIVASSKPVLAGKKIKPTKAERSEPLWLGPESADERGGITFSMLSRWLTCRERFRVKFVLGLSPAERFRSVIEFGNMWHVCEEALAAARPWEDDLRRYGSELVKKYPSDQEEVQRWYNICKTQFPVYVDYWSKHPDVKNRTPLLQEHSFHVPYVLPSGRTVYLRGKWDSIDLIGKGKDAGVYLQENKTKSKIDVVELSRQVTYDLQTMMYLVALDEWVRGYGQQNLIALVRDDQGDSGKPKRFDAPIRGIRYNVVRRDCPIRQHKPSKSNPQGETAEHFYDRLKTDYLEAEPEKWFYRLKIDVTPSDVQQFRRETLDPILEQLCDWYEWVAEGPTEFAGRLLERIQRGYEPTPHWRHPFGCVNTIDEYGASDLDEYLNTGSTVGLVETKLFPELGV